jgi:hypothetical protein
LFFLEALMIPVGWDSETHLIKAGMLAPRMVCLSYEEPSASGVVLRPQGLVWLRSRLVDPNLLLVAHNAPYDLAVACAEEPELLPLVFDAYDAGRICCTVVRQQLFDVALGMRKWRRNNGQVTPARYGLADLVKLYFNEHLEKEDTWRLRYALLDGVPIAEWPQDAIDYAVSDAKQCLRVYQAQGKEMKVLFGKDLPNELEQQRAAWALHLMSIWGVRADEVAVDHFIGHCQEEIAKMHKDLDGSGIFKPDGSRTMSEIRRRVTESFASMSVKVPMTDPSLRFPEGQVQTDKETLELTDDPYLQVLATSMTFVKHLGQWGPVCKAAVHRPVCSRYNVLVDTGRTSCGGSEGQEGTNFQNPPRAGDVRPCFIPRFGNLLCATDADTIELRAHAQNNLEMVGWSRMAEVLVKQHKEGGADLHLTLAAAIMGITVEEAFERKKNGDEEVNKARQFAKIPGFGFPGGLGPKTFVGYAAAQGQKLAPTPTEALERAKYLREVWFETWPENREYFKIIGTMIDRGTGRGTITQRMSGRIRGDTSFTAAANGFFQGRVADGMKEVLWRLAYECYTGRCSTCHAKSHTCPDCEGEGRSILYGSRPVMFLHDEPILEHPEDGSESARAERQRVIVVDSLQRWMPDIPITSSAVLLRCWYKGAEPLKINGKLVPVKPEKNIGADGKVHVKWVHDQCNRLAA